ncbi:MAG: beta-lactamase family protein [Sphingobacterium sp.]|nr:beta-lactamase family protein [Sphingobacterium sp.]
MREMKIVKPSTKKQIDKILYHEKAIKLDSVLKSITSKNHFNGNILVAYKGNCIYKESFGYADLIKKEELTTESVFQLASLSKQFTAMAVMILKEQGKINYDDSVTMYIPEIPYKGITIRMLLNHTSGLPNYMWLTEKQWTEKSIPITKILSSCLQKQIHPVLYTLVAVSIIQIQVTLFWHQL